MDCGTSAVRVLQAMVPLRSPLHHIPGITDNHGPRVLGPLQECARLQEPDI